MSSICVDILERARKGKRIKVFTLSGLLEQPVLAGAVCEGSFVLVKSVPSHEGIPCYPVIVECGEDFFKYTVLENYYRLRVNPDYVVEEVKDDYIVVERRDSVLFKIADPLTTYVIRYLRGKSSVYFYSILEDLLLAESLSRTAEYSEDLVETLTIKLGLAIGYLAYETGLVEIQDN